MGSQHLAIKQLHLISMGRRFKSPSFQTLIKSNSAAVIAVDLRICGSLRFRQACEVRLDSNTASSAPVRSSICGEELELDFIMLPYSMLKMTSGFFFMLCGFICALCVCCYTGEQIGLIDTLNGRFNPVRPHDREKAAKRATISTSSYAARLLLSVSGWPFQQHRWVAMDTRPLCGKPGRPLFEKHPPPLPHTPPTTLQPPSLAASVSWHHKAPKKSSSFQIFRFNRWFQRGAEVFFSPQPLRNSPVSSMPSSWHGCWEEGEGGF